VRRPSHGVGWFKLSAEPQPYPKKKTLRVLFYEFGVHAHIDLLCTDIF
jgi:hypothetical protein